MKQLFRIKKIADCKDLDQIVNKIRNYLNDDNNKLYDLLFTTKKEIILNGVDTKPSQGENAFMWLDDFLSSEYEYYLLDEPETHLNNKFIVDVLLEKFRKLVDNGKTIIMSMHNNILGINTIPMNYIFRDISFVDNTKKYQTYVGNLSEKEITSLFDNSKINLWEKILIYFEGNKKTYDERIYIWKNQIKF